MKYSAQWSTQGILVPYHPIEQVHCEDYAKEQRKTAEKNESLKKSIKNFSLKA